MANEDQPERIEVLMGEMRQTIREEHARTFTIAAERDAALARVAELEAALEDARATFRSMNLAAQATKLVADRDKLSVAWKTFDLEVERVHAQGEPSLVWFDWRVGCDNAPDAYSCEGHVFVVDGKVSVEAARKAACAAAEAVARALHGEGVA